MFTRMLVRRVLGMKSEGYRQVGSRMYNYDEGGCIAAFSWIKRILQIEPLLVALQR